MEMGPLTLEQQDSLMSAAFFFSSSTFCSFFDGAFIFDMPSSTRTAHVPHTPAPPLQVITAVSRHYVIVIILPYQLLSFPASGYTSTLFD
jgi:hypothetical protein